MTLVVGRVDGARVAIASDTRITKFGLPLRETNGVIKSCILPGGLCVSFAHSRDLAIRHISEFAQTFPSGTTYSATVAHFVKSSKKSGNQYLLAFASGPKLVKIADGCVVKGLARTQWIGDQSAFEKFREYETRSRKFPQAGRAFNAVYFADELPSSPASDLYSTMRNVVLDKSVESTGGFVFLVSNRENGFRQSVYSDMLYDWPENKDDDFKVNYNAPLDLGSSGENVSHAVAQISPGIVGMNLVGFYFLAGKKLFLFHGYRNGPPDKCMVLSDVEPTDITTRLNQALGVKMFWLLTITSPYGVARQSAFRTTPNIQSPNGLGLQFYCHANTFPKRAG